MTIAVKEFLDHDSNIRPELLDEEALKIAEELSRTNLSTHQVRKFYDEVKQYKARLDKGEDFKKILPLILMLKSKANYAYNKERDNKKKDGLRLLYEFIRQSIEKIKEEDEKDKKDKFNAFCLFFEAVYGFANLKKN